MTPCPIRRNGNNKTVAGLFPRAQVVKFADTNGCGETALYFFLVAMSISAFKLIPILAFLRVPTDFGRFCQGEQLSGKKNTATGVGPRSIHLKVNVVDGDL